MQVLPVPCLRDNFAYLVTADSGRTAVVDPSQADPVLRALGANKLDLHEIWLTHHHWDHVGGIEALVEEVSVEAVRGSTYDQSNGRIPRQTEGLSNGDTFEFGGHEVRILAIPGHTLGAIAFIVEGHLFSGDTLFLSGCGRVFEGTMPMMAASLRKLRALPPETQIWCGHEYTVNNLRFAKTVEPSNPAIDAALEEAMERRAASAFTVPGTIGAELETNPFFRFDLPEVAAGRAPDDSFAEIRRRKDNF